MKNSFFILIFFIQSLSVSGQVTEVTEGNTIEQTLSTLFQYSAMKKPTRFVKSSRLFYCGILRGLNQRLFTGGQRKSPK
jgi:hypothetical protein